MNLDHTQDLRASDVLPYRGLRNLLKRAAPAILTFVALALLTGGVVVGIAWLDEEFGLSSPAVMRLGTSGDAGGAERR